MILYENTAKGFLDDVDNSVISEKLDTAFRNKVGHTVAPNEKRSWDASLTAMGIRVRRSSIPDDCGVLLEYNLPGTGKRIDFLISGTDIQGQENFVIVELKQWDKAEAEEGMPHTVKGPVGGGMRDVNHPAYQAFSYKQYLRDMSTAMENKELHPYSCAYLHNYIRQDPEPLLAEQYQGFVTDTPVFFKHDTQKLEEFIRKYVGKGKGMRILYEIANGKIRPTKDFVTYITELYHGNSVFTLLDEQQTAYDQIMNAATLQTGRVTILVNGGPGTGKSVVAMNAFVHLLQQGHNVQYVTPNTAFREYLIEELANHKSDKKSRLNAVFKGSFSYYDCTDKQFDTLIIDEAHRLKRKGAYQYRGDSQVDDMIKTSRVNIFFVDDEQQIRPDDEGSVDLIRQIARKYNSRIVEVHLNAQFRCSGENGFINWLDDVLQIHETANATGWDNNNYDVRLFDTPNDLVQAIREKDQNGYDARIVAGFAWNWTSEKKGNPNAEINDVVMPEYGFSMPWNSHKNQKSWSINPDQKNEIGCIHTIQGQEKDYIGVIIGNDMRFDPKSGRIYADVAEYKDKQGMKGIKNHPDEVLIYIKNIYKILLTRGKLGCYIFVRDPELKIYIKKRLKIATSHENTL